MFRGLASAFIGIILATVGTSPIDGTMRYTFGSYHLIGGLSLVGVMMGLFAIQQVVLAHGQGQKEKSASKTPEEFGKGCPDGVWALIKKAINKKKTVA